MTMMHTMQTIMMQHPQAQDNRMKYSTKDKTLTLLAMMIAQYQFTTLSLNQFTTSQCTIMNQSITSQCIIMNQCIMSLTLSRSITNPTLNRSITNLTLSRYITSLHLSRSIMSQITTVTTIIITTNPPTKSQSTIHHSQHITLVRYIMSVMIHMLAHILTVQRVISIHLITTSTQYIISLLLSMILMKETHTIRSHTKST